MEFTSLTFSITFSILFTAILTAIALGHLNFLPSVKYPVEEYKSISGARGLAAFFVFINHAPPMLLNMGIKAPNVSSWGWIYSNLGSFGVQIFFCITGFLFFDRIIKTNGKLDWNRFFESRVRRVAPLFYFACFIYIIFAFISNESLHLDKSDMLTIAGLASFGFIDSSMTIGDFRLYPLNSVIWTLVHEWRFYMALPLVCFAFCNSRIGKIVFLVACIAAIIDFKNSQVVCWPYFLTGIIVAYIANKKPKIDKKAHILLLLITAITFIITLGIKIENGYSWHRYLLSSAFFISVVLGDPKILHWQPLRYLGEISYSVYLLHLPILYSCIWILSTFIDINSITQNQYWLFIVAIVPLTVLICSFSFKFIEFRFMKRNKSHTT